MRNWRAEVRREADERLRREREETERWRAERETRDRPARNPYRNCLCWSCTRARLQVRQSRK